MPIVTTPAPIEAQQAFHQGIGSFLAGPDLDNDLTHQAFIGGQPKLPAIADIINPAAPAPVSHENFILGLRALGRGTGITSAKSMSWRFLAGSTASEAVAGECSQDAETGVWRLTQVAYGSGVWEMIDAANSLSQLPGIPPLAEFHVRYLKIPGILVEAFWLASPDGSADLAVVFPLPPNQLQRRLNDQAVYEMPVFLNIVSALSAERLRFSARKG